MQRCLHTCLIIALVTAHELAWAVQVCKQVNGLIHVTRRSSTCTEILHSSYYQYNKFRTSVTETITGLCCN